jgi:hypothetical protein
MQLGIAGVPPALVGVSPTRSSQRHRTKWFGVIARQSHRRDADGSDRDGRDPHFELIVAAKRGLFCRRATKPTCCPAVLIATAFTMLIAARRILRVHPYVRVMKMKILSLALFQIVGLLLTTMTCLAQPRVPGNPAGAGYALQQPPRTDGPKFDMDFGGGTPRQLVDAIEKATGAPLNAIIPEQDKDVLLPAVKVRQVTIDDFFLAMEQSSVRQEAQVTGTYFSDFGGAGSRSQYTMVNTSCGFHRTGDLWVFTNKRATPLPDVVAVKTRFYQLEPFFPQHTVEDITTAIQTAWKMMAENKMATTGAKTDLKFHKETGLLIAVGDPAQVQVIDDVLLALRPDLAFRLKPSETRKTNASTKTPAAAN